MVSGVSGAGAANHAFFRFLENGQCKPSGTNKEAKASSGTGTSQTPPMDAHAQQVATTAQMNPGPTYPLNRWIKRVRINGKKPGKERVRKARSGVLVKGLKVGDTLTLTFKVPEGENLIVADLNIQAFTAPTLSFSAGEEGAESLRPGSRPIPLDAGKLEIKDISYEEGRKKRPGKLTITIKVNALPVVQGGNTPEYTVVLKQGSAYFATLKFERPVEKQPAVETGSKEAAATTDSTKTAKKKAPAAKGKRKVSRSPKKKKATAPKVETDEMDPDEYQ